MRNIILSSIHQKRDQMEQLITSLNSAHIDFSKLSFMNVAGALDPNGATEEQRPIIATALIDPKRYLQNCNTWDMKCLGS